MSGKFHISKDKRKPDSNDPKLITLSDADLALIFFCEPAHPHGAGPGLLEPRWAYALGSD